MADLALAHCLPPTDVLGSTTVNGDEMRSFVTATMIAERLCSPRRDGQELLPQLVEKLVTASVPSAQIRQLRFPHEDHIYLHGSDGVLVVDDAVDHQHVPAGMSLWEMGTSNDPKAKADDDFPQAPKKLANSFPNIIPSVTPDKATFVFVTPKGWESGAWVREKRSISSWRAIRVIDAIDLEKWLEKCPAVMLWFADVCGLPAEGLFNAEQYLRILGTRSGVTLTPDLVIAGRNDEAEKLQDYLIKSKATVTVYGESVEEAAAFLASMVVKEVKILNEHPPVIFTDARANLKLLATFNSELTLVPLDSDTIARAKDLNQAKWRLVVLGIHGPGTRGATEGVVLPKCKRHVVEQYLATSLKLPEHRARQIVRDSRGSFAALMWLIGSETGSAPRWACRKDATTHASLMLAGSWIGSNTSDVSVVERLSRKDYRGVETLLQSALLPEGPWIHRGVEWLCASKEFLWSQLASKVTETMLIDFRYTCSSWRVPSM